MPFTLSDQFGQETAFRVPPQKTVILAFSNQASSALLREWLAHLSPAPGDQVILIACTGWVPFFVKGQVRRAFLAQKPILIDWDNRVANHYGFGEIGCLLVKIGPAEM